MSLEFEIVKICKRNTESAGVLNMPYHVTTRILKLSPYLNRRFTVSHDEYLLNFKILKQGDVQSIVHDCRIYSFFNRISYVTEDTEL